jgi:hypothetical protein
MAFLFVIFATVLFLVCPIVVFGAPNGTTVQTTSGTLVGVENNGGSYTHTI